MKKNKNLPLQFPELYNEFMGLCYDDPDFNYSENEFEEWLTDYCEDVMK
jgi:hypothetical protein